MFHNLTHKIVKLVFGKTRADQYFYKVLLSYQHDLPIFSMDHFQYCLDDGVPFEGHKEKYLHAFLDYYGIEAKGLTLKQRIALYKLTNIGP